MKTIKDLFGIAVFALCTIAAFTACSDDDDNNDNGNGSNGNIDPTIVFTGKRINGLDGSTMTYNKDGLLTQVRTSDETVTFSYEAATRAAGTHVKMTISYPDYPQEGEMYIDMTIGKNGFVESAVETYEKDSDVDTWAFGYNSAGQLNYMKRSEGGNEVTNITYENGNITRVVMKSENDNSQLDAGISYGSAPIENKGCIMLFDATFGIDMDEMEYAYWAGILGKATHHLPVSYKESDENRTFDWNINSDGYPTSMSYQDYGSTESFKFNW